MYLVKISRVETHEATSGVTKKALFLGNYITRLDNTLRGFLNDLAVSRLKRKNLERTERLMVNIEDILEQLATRPLSSQRQRRTAGGGMYADTPYSHIIGEIVNANKRMQFHKLLIDQTGVGEPITEELKNQEVTTTEGITFTTQTKEKLLTNLKLTMEQNRLKLLYNRQLIEQINQQQYDYTKTGHLTFSHPQGTHDDQLWALTLATHAATNKTQPTLKIIQTRR